MSLAPRIDTIEASFRKRNFLINPSMYFWQRGDTFAPAVDLGYIADRYQWRQGGGSGAVQVTRVQDDPSGLGWCARMEVTTAQVMAGFDIVAFEQKIEGLNARFLYGQDCRVDFWVKTNKPGTYSLTFANYDFSRTYVTEYEITSADTWEKVSILLTMDAFGPKWNDDNTIGIQVWWNLDSGPSRETASLDSWNDVTIAESISGTNQTSFMDTIGNYFQITNCQLVTGHEEVPFEFLERDIGEELRLCQRYFEKSYDVNIAPGSLTTIGMQYQLSTGWSSTNEYRDTAQFKVFKRTIPNVTAYNPVNGVAGQIYSFRFGNSRPLGPTNTGQSSSSFSHGAGVNVHSGGGFHWVADAEL